SLSNRYSEVSFDELYSVWYNGGIVDDSTNDISEELRMFLSHNLELITDAVLYERGSKTIGTIDNNKESNKITTILVAQKNGITIPETIKSIINADFANYLIRAKSQSFISKRITEFDLFEENGKIYDISKTILTDDTALAKMPTPLELSFLQ